MSPDERNLIINLFDRIREAGAIDKDRQAATLIKDAVRQLPDAPYVLVQSVLLQENALAEAQARIDELEARIADLEAEQQPQSSGRSGGFLGGSVLGGGRSAARDAGSVPNVSAERSTSSVWGSSRPAEREAAVSQSGFRQPAMPPMPQQPAQSGGGGFFRSAMAAAAGVAGGVLLSDSLKGMMGGGSQSHHAGSEPHYQDPANNDPGVTQKAEADPVDDTSWADSDDSMDA